MKKNFIQRHMIWASLILVCFLFIPAIKDSYCMESDDKTASVQSIDKKEPSVEKIRVVLDPGHGGYDDGSVSEDGIKEKDLTLIISKKVGSILEKNNIEVIYTRTSDEVTWSDDNVEDLLERSRIANESNAACFVSIHLNSSDVYQDEIRGHEIWVNYEDDRNVELAKAIQTKMQKLSNSEDRGIKDQATSPLSILVYNKIPTVLVETGFLSNAQDTAYVQSEKGSDEIAEAIAEGIMKFITEK